MHESLKNSFDESSLSTKLKCQYCVNRSRSNGERWKGAEWQRYLSEIKSNPTRFNCRSLVFASLTPKEVVLSSFLHFGCGSFIRLL